MVFFISYAYLFIFDLKDDQVRNLHVLFYEDLSVDEIIFFQWSERGFEL